MTNFYGAVLLACLTIGLSVRLVSKKHHCEKITSLVLVMLYFLCVVNLQTMGFASHSVWIFWGISLLICGAVLLHASFSAGVYYYLKDFDLTDEKDLQNLSHLLRQYQRTHLTGRAEITLKTRVLVFKNVSEQDIKNCLTLINQYIDEHGCSNIHDWRLMILIAATLQSVALFGVVIYNLLV